MVLKRLEDSKLNGNPHVRSRPMAPSWRFQSISPSPRLESPLSPPLTPPHNSQNGEKASYGPLEKQYRQPTGHPNFQNGGNHIPAHDCVLEIVGGKKNKGVSVVVVGGGCRWS